MQDQITIHNMAEMTNTERQVESRQKNHAAKLGRTPEYEEAGLVEQVERWHIRLKTERSYDAEEV